MNSMNGTNISVYSLRGVGILFSNVPLGGVSISVAVGNTMLPVVTFCVGTNLRRKTGLRRVTKAVRGSVLGRFVIHGACVCPPTFSVGVVSSVFRCASRGVPGFGSVSVSNCRVRRTNTATSVRLTCALTSNLRCLQTKMTTNVSVSTFTPHLSFF